MSSVCPKCGMSGDRRGSNYVCPCCGNKWMTESAHQAQATSDLRQTMRDNRNDWNNTVRETQRSFDATDDALRRARQANKSAKPKSEKKKGGILIPIICGIIGVAIMKNAAGLIIGLIVGFIISAAGNKK